MTKEETKIWIEKHGWHFVAEHDIPTEFGVKAHPECWIHEYHPTQWSEEDVLDFIEQQYLLQAERDIE